MLSPGHGLRVVNPKHLRCNAQVVCIATYQPLLTGPYILQVVLVALAGVFWLCYLRLLLPLRNRLDLAIEVISSIADVFCFVGALVLTIVKTDNVKYTCAPQAAPARTRLLSLVLGLRTIVGSHFTCSGDICCIPFASLQAAESSLHEASDQWASFHRGPSWCMQACMAAPSISTCTLPVLNAEESSRPCSSGTCNPPSGVQADRGRPHDRVPGRRHLAVDPVPAVRLVADPEDGLRAARPHVPGGWHRCVRAQSHRHQGGGHRR